VPQAKHGNPKLLRQSHGQRNIVILFSFRRDFGDGPAYFRALQKGNPRGR